MMRRHLHANWQKSVSADSINEIDSSPSIYYCPCAVFPEMAAFKHEVIVRMENVQLCIIRCRLK